ncbi:MAG: hypothetical protein ACAI35_08265 [Candidatus Methylacidiphilales bacterium]|nr:hypothetical protein [Candidatus Methylacidiphilales bacterium]
MPNVGLLEASEPLSPKNRVVIRFSVEVDELPVYNESYDVDKLLQELRDQPEETLKRWSWRLLSAAYARDKEGFSACLTRGLVDGMGSPKGKGEGVDLKEAVCGNAGESQA